MADLSRPRVYHRAKHIGPNGEVSALCFKKPRAIDMSKRVTWTTNDAAVTCPACRKLIIARALAGPGGNERAATTKGDR